MPNVPSKDQLEIGQDRPHAIDGGGEATSSPERQFELVAGGKHRTVATAKNRRAWRKIRDAYLDAISELDDDDPDRQLMAEQCRLAAEIAGLPPLAPAGAGLTRRASQPSA